MTEPVQNQCLSSGYRRQIGSLVVDGDLVGIQKQFVQEYMNSMSTGKLQEFAEAWYSADVVHRSEGLPFSFQSDGREGYLKSYNDLITGHYGSPDAEMLIAVDGMARLAEKNTRLDMTVTTTGKRDMVERIRMDFTYNDMFQVSNVMITTPDSTSSVYSACGAVIKPVTTRQTNQSSRKSARRSQPREPSTIVQAPSFHRPCLHNLWDSVRIKKGVVLLRCRTCVSQWKLAASEIVKCKSFLSEQGCQLGALCDNLHIHARKKTFEDRVAESS